MENFCQRGNLSQKTADEMTDVLYDRSVSDNKIVYKMCRAEKQNRRLRYDITLLYANPLGQEFSKTYGHYHQTGKPEFYEVLSEKIFFLAQKYENFPEKITEAYLIKVEQGEKFIIPPNFAMAAINPSLTKNALLANWIDSEEQNDYAPIKKLKGFCYYILAADNHEGKFNAIPNKNYEQIPPLTQLKPAPIPEELKNLEFLTEPEKYKKLLTIEKLYEKLN